MSAFVVTPDHAPTTVAGPAAAVDRTHALGTPIPTDRGGPRRTPGRVTRVRVAAEPPSDRGPVP